MNEAMLRSLDEARPVQRRWWVTYSIGMTVFAMLFGFFIARFRDVSVGLPLVATAHAVAMGLTYGLLAFLFFTQARGERQFGYLVLGFTFGLTGLIWAWFPYFFPNGLAYSVPARPVVGDANSAAMLYIVNRWVVLAGVAVGGYVISRVNMLARSTRPRVAGTVVLMVVSAGAILAGAAYGSISVPALVTAGSVPSDATRVISAAAVFVSVAVVMMLARTSCSGSIISRWLLTLAVLQFLEAAAGPFAPRYSANWLAIRWMSLIGSLVLLFTLLSQLSRIQRATARAADLDALTGTLSRSAFVRVVAEHLSSDVSTNAGSGLLWIDLDQFRVVNASAGAAAGDAFLRACAARLEASVPSQGFVARIGGDEFAMLLPASSTADLVERAIGIGETLSEPLEFDEERLVTSASVGCVWIDAEIDSAEEAMRRAFAAMQAAKEAGGDTARIYSPAVDAHAAEEVQWRHRLALAVRDGAFANVYQPIFASESGTPVGVEALIRLVDGAELVPAGRFIRFAESSGQIVAIGRIGLQQLIYDMPRLLSTSLPTPVWVSLNLSVLQLADPITMGMLLKPPLQTHASQIVVEVTESFELSASMSARENLMRLVRAGYRIAIDDFGAGFSNFVQLEEIGRHLIKLDRSLIVRAGTRESASLTVLTAALAVAKSLASEVLAEGVETEAEAQIVQELGIPLVQGFRYARPMPLEDAIECLRKGERG